MNTLTILAFVLAIAAIGCGIAAVILGIMSRRAWRRAELNAKLDAIKNGEL